HGLHRSYRSYWSRRNLAWLGANEPRRRGSTQAQGAATFGPTQSCDAVDLRKNSTGRHEGTNHHDGERRRGGRLVLEPSTSIPSFATLAREGIAPQAEPGFNTVSMRLARNPGACSTSRPRQ